jgi:PAS domain S-box-containing protein/putative nucleotidyltransferase with HDIG domain
VLVSSGLLYFLIEAWRGAESGDAGSDAVPALKGMRRLLPVLIALAFTVPAIGLSVVVLSSSQTERDATMDLGAIAELKAAQIEYWLAERRGDATALASSTGFIMRVEAMQRSGGAPEEFLVRDRLAALLQAFSYDAIALLDARQKPLLFQGSTVELTPATLAMAREAMSSEKVQMGELYRASNGEVLVDFVAPLILGSGGAKRVPGAAVLQVNAARFLYPLIKSWPTSSESGETNLVRRDGESVVYLNALRFGAAPALTLRIPLADANLPAAQAALKAAPGSFTGADYRGVPVLAAYRPVAGTNWHLVAKIDRAEAMAPLYRLAEWVSLIGLFAVVAVAAALVVLWRQQRLADGLVLRLRETELFKTFHDMPFVGLATMPLRSKRWENVNDQLCAMLGYSREALAAMTWTDVLHSEEVPASMAEFERLARGEIDGYTLEKRLVRKDGMLVFAAISVRSIRGVDGNVDSILVAVQDITERKRAELEAKRLTMLYAALSECNAAILRCATEQQLFERICRIMVEDGGVKMAWVGLTDPDSGMIPRVASYGAGEEYLTDLRISVAAASEYGKGPTGIAVREGRDVWCQDFQHDPMTARWHERGVKFGWGASGSLPLRRGGASVGAVTVYHGEANAFDAASQKLLLELAAQISFALDNFDREADRLRAELALRESDAYSRALIAAIPDIIFTNRRDGEFLACEVSDPTRLLLPPESFLHRKVAEVLPADIAEQFMEAYAHALDTGRTQEVNYQLVVNSEKRYFEARVVPSGADSVVSLVRDTTDAQRVQRRLAESEERLRGLLDQVITGIYILQDGKFVYVNRRFAEIAGYDSPDEIIGRDPMMLVAEADRANASEMMRRRFAGEVKSVSYNLVGIRKDGSRLDVGLHGAIATFDGRPAIIGMMQDISEKKRAEDQAARYLAQLQTAFMRTVEVATTISEMRDPYTAGHEKRVAEIAVAIGTELGFDAARLEGLRVAGYLHDVGKITIPAEILAKPGKLSAVEYQLIKGHAQASFDILKDVEFPWPVAQIALQHHERMDGSGYPQGLKGDAILLDARVMAVADTVEAMSSHRPYRPGLGIDKALAEIERGRGAAYDAQVADACLRIFREKGYALPE